MKKLTGGSLLAISTIVTPAAFAHSHAGADHSHLESNLTNWLGHVLTSGGHQFAVVGIAMVIVGGLTFYKLTRKTIEKNDTHSE